MVQIHRLTLLLVIALVFLAACGPVKLKATQSVATSAPHEAADLVVKNGYIYTVDAQRSVAEAMAVKGDAIVYIGDNTGVDDWVGTAPADHRPGWEMVLPGLVDSHAHAPDVVSELYEVSLYGMSSVDEIRLAIQDFVTAAPDLSALKGAAGSMPSLDPMDRPGISWMGSSRTSRQYFIRKISTACGSIRRPWSWPGLPGIHPTRQVGSSSGMPMAIPPAPCGKARPTWCMPSSPIIRSTNIWTA